MSPPGLHIVVVVVVVVVAVAVVVVIWKMESFVRCCHVTASRTTAGPQKSSVKMSAVAAVGSGAEKAPENCNFSN